MLDKNAIRERCLKHHSPTGPVIAALDEVLNTSYPAGTNLVLKFVEKFIGWKYGAKDMCMDEVVDCEELWRIAFYIWFGIDIGNFSDAAYKSILGTTISEDFDSVYSARPLDLFFYNTSSAKITGHVAAKYDDTRIFHSGAKENNSKVNFSAITWNKSLFMCIRRFISDDQFASIIVGGVEVPQEAQYWRALKNKGVPYLDGADVLRVQTRLGELGYFKGSLGGNYGPITESAIRAFQKSNGLSVDGVCGPKTWAALFTGAAKAKAAVEIKYKRALRNAGKPYMYGDDVAAVQEALKAAGFDPGEIDGSYGPQTAAAVVAYQNAHGLTVDGVCGPKTWAALMA